MSWINIKILACPKNIEYKYEDSNIGWLDQCFTCERREKCREIIQKFEDEQEGGK